MNSQHILIAGGSGFIGSQLVPELLKRGAQVTVVSRHPEQTLAAFHHAVTTLADINAISADCYFDAIINLTGQGIADQRWSDDVKQQLRASRLVTTQALVDYMQRAKRKPMVFLSGSAIGYYGAHQDEILTEADGGDQSFASRLCADWEQCASAAEALGVRTCYLRTGIVLASEGGALAKMLPAFKVGLGGPMGSGQQWMSWLHIQDWVGLLLALLEHPTMSGPVNFTAPQPVQNKQFAQCLAKVLHRPAVVTVPAFGLRGLFGQMAEELLLSGQRVMPEKMLKAGYVFKFEQLEAALADVLL